MDSRKILFVALILLILFAIGFNLFGFEHNNPLAESLKAHESKEDVSMAVTGDIMLGRNVAGAIGSDSLPLAGISNVTSNVDLLLINLEMPQPPLKMQLRGTFHLNAIRVMWCLLRETTIL